MRKILTALVFLVSLTAMADVLDPPSLRCASVLPNGDVALTWVVPPDPGNIFQEYAIYSSNVSQAGPYAVVATSNIYGLGTFTHTSAGADTGPRWYFLTTITVDPQPNESFASDTLQTIFLVVTQSSPLGSAVLDWNILHDPPMSTTDDAQVIELEFPQGVWTPVDQVDPVLDHYEELISICEDSLTFRIAVEDQLGCTSYSSLDGGIFQDITAPTSPDIVTVSVDITTNQAVIDWDPSPEPDTDGYIIYHIINGIPLDPVTVYGQFNTSFTWVNSSAADGPESFGVVAFDTCITDTHPSGNTSASQSYHTSVFTTTDYDRCQAECRISWTPYVGWDVGSYEVYAALNGGTAALIATVSGTTHTFLHDDLVPFAEYCYTVQAIGDSAWMRSVSNRICQLTDYPAIPQYNYLRVATVVDKDHIVVVDSVDQSASVRRYRLERTNNGGPWEEVASQPGSSSPTIVFNDLDVLTDQRSYSYRIVVEDSCGIEAVTSNEGTSILLVAEAGADGVNRLRWNGYEEWAGNVSGFTVHRSIGDGPFTPITFTGALEWEAEDNVNELYTSNGRFCYYVEATESGNTSGINATSTSNTACAIQGEAVWVPNAFNAGSTIAQNSVFQPVVAFVDVKGYEFIIFNRWGQQIWNTTDLNEPWKGTVNGNYVPQGVYAYYVSVLNGAGKKFEERGAVTFLCCP